MPMRIVSGKLDPGIVTLPWSKPLEDWGDDVVVPLPRGLSRHIVRIVRAGDGVFAVKETQEQIAFREYHLLRDLARLGLPAVHAQAVITGRENGLPACLVTRHLRFSLPYRSLFAHGATAENLPSLIDAIVVLLVRLHLDSFFWGDVSLSNVLFRRDAGAFVAYLVDAETGELRPELGDRMREHDVTIGCENIFAELLDLGASGLVESEFDALHVVNLLRERYDALWTELTSEELFDAGELWRIEKRVERLNELGFDVEELDVVTDFDGDRITMRPRVVEAGHHRRELQALTGLDVEDNQARRLLNDLSSFTAHFDLGREDRSMVAHRWLTEIYQPIMALVPAEARGKLEPAEIFHEILVHRWYLSEKAGHEVDLFETARDYVEGILTSKPDEAITAPPD